MKINAASKKPSKKKRLKIAVLYGFNLQNKEEVGYFGKNLDIVQERSDAKEFPIKGKKSEDFASPSKWCKFINDDSTLNHGYKFHIVNFYKQDI